MAGKMPWQKGTNKLTGWEILSNPEVGHFERDWQDNYYYLYSVYPVVTLNPIADDAEVANLKKAFRRAYGY